MPLNSVSIPMTVLIILWRECNVVTVPCIVFLDWFPERSNCPALLWPGTQLDTECGSETAKAHLLPPRIMPFNMSNIYMVIYNIKYLLIYIMQRGNIYEILALQITDSSHIFILLPWSFTRKFCIQNEPQNAGFPEWKVNLMQRELHTSRKMDQEINAKDCKFAPQNIYNVTQTFKI